MARKSPSRLDKRREAEAVEALEKASGKKATKKKATKKKTTKRKTTKRRTKAKSTARKRLMWGIFNGNMKEEGRFPYHEREAADEKLEALKTKSPKKMFFIQPIKEEITAATKADDEDDE